MVVSEEDSDTEPTGAATKLYKFAEPATGYYLGFDKDTYPGDTLMTAWWTNSPFWYVGFYLAPAPNHTDTSWMTKRSHLKAQGWGFLVTYVGLQEGSSSLSYARGETDAVNAASLATSAGFPLGTTIFLDIESGGTLPTNLISYITGWVHKIVVGTIFNAGVYCSRLSAAQIKTAVGTDPVFFWCTNLQCPTPSPGCNASMLPPNPANCGYSGAIVWQYAESPVPAGTGCTNYSGNLCTLTYGASSTSVDLDTADSQNPSNG